MASIARSEVNTFANTYLRNRVNQINPWHSGRRPTSGVNSALLNTFSTAPPAATATDYISANSRIIGTTVRTAVLALGNYYSRIMWCRYGVTGNHTGVFTSYDYFSVLDSAPGVAAFTAATRTQIAAAVVTPTGSVSRDDITSMYTAAWNVINSRRDQIEVNLTVCHSSYVAPPHSARGRR